ncbi:MAG TPA: TetR/AcrR family transcriptional regulator [Acidimicrobiales bacterium]
MDATRVTATDRSADLRGRLIDATERVMRRSGPLNVRVDEVARLAGCSRATLYRHVADKDELVREVLVGLARQRSAAMAPALAAIDDPAHRIAEGVLRTVEGIRGEWWYAELARHGATAAVARLGGGPQAFVALTEPLVAPFIEHLDAQGLLRPGVTVTDATEWLCVVTTGVLATESTGGRSRDGQVAFLRRYVADPLLRRR